MAAFEKINCGIDGLDKVLDHIRLGDNVVLQVSHIDEYILLAEALAKQAIIEKRNVLYIRFAQHKPLLKPGPGLKIVELDTGAGFESFSVEVHDIIERQGREAIYIFDSISELQAAWSADLMMGNFFVVTCPFLFELDTVAYFGIIRGRHSFDTIARIRETTQVLIDIYSEGNEIYLHPLKVWKRYSNTMFLPHRFEKSNPEDFTTLTGGLGVSRFYALMERKAGAFEDQNLDNWDRFFLYAKMDPGRAGRDVIDEMCERLIGTDKKIAGLISENFDIRDLIAVKERMIGSGKIGGKAAGMLLARKIIENNDARAHSRLESHDSFYIGSDVYYTYIVQNDCWKLRLLQKRKEEYFSSARLLKEKILSGVFPDTTREQFRRLLEYYGQSPIIVRSSSLLEDSFSNAFAGKYESVFCVNTGSLDKRLRSLEKAIKQVYASTMDESALEYRLKRGLVKNDEQMAILVQRVSGLKFDSVFMPCAAGVGYSYNSYRWHKDIDPDAGMARMVMGLGTRAVERTEGDYPRIAGLGNPQISPLTSNIEKSQFSQHKVDVLDIEKDAFSSVDLQELSPKLPGWYKRIMVEHDHEAERLLEEQAGEENVKKKKEVLFSTCEGLLRMGDFTGSLRDMMSLIQKHYDYPVDIEFACNFTEEGDFLINLLQCRPLQTGGGGAKVKIPRIEDSRVFFELSGGTMGGALKKHIDTVIQVDPEGYCRLPYRKKYDIARSIGRLNHYFKDICEDRGKAGRKNKDKENTVMLLAPGRIGTTSPETGVPVKFAEISNIDIICEVSYKKGGYMPELSFGSHFFNDLVEEGIFYAAIFEDDNIIRFDPDLFRDMKNMITDICEDLSDIRDIIRVYDVSNIGLAIYSDIMSGRSICGVVQDPAGAV